MQIKKLYLILPLLCILLLISGCTAITDPDETESNRVEDQQNIYIDSQPVPTFDWSLERHIFIELYKARNNAVQTYSYIRNWQGQVVFSCKSIGFPLPSNLQLTNPEREERIYQGGISLPQAEPNGLFSSPSTMGTYVFCINSDGTVSPSYFEASVETHLSPLNNTSNALEGESELKITIK